MQETKEWILFKDGKEHILDKNESFRKGEEGIKFILGIEEKTPLEIYSDNTMHNLVTFQDFEKKPGFYFIKESKKIEFLLPEGREQKLGEKVDLLILEPKKIESKIQIGVQKIKGQNAPKAMSIASGLNMEKLLENAGNKLEIKPKKVYNASGFQIEEITDIVHKEVIYFTTEIDESNQKTLREFFKSLQ